MLGLIVGKSFPSTSLLVEPTFSSPESAAPKAKLDYRIKKFSSWLMTHNEQNLPPRGLAMHIRCISAAVLELHNVEPEALEPKMPVLALAQRDLRKAVTDAIFDVHGKRFEAKFNAMLLKWGDTQLSPPQNETTCISLVDRASYLVSAEHISGQIADKIGNDVCNALDALVRPVIAKQVAAEERVADAA